MAFRGAEAALEVVVLDTSVLFPAPLCDTLLRAARRGLYRARWSADILAELQGNLIEDRGLNQAQARHRIDEMQAAFPEATVIDYRGLVGAMTNHPKDRHVLAAAVVADATPS